jgi:hypothetical protein
LKKIIFLSDAPPVLLYSFIEQTLQPGPAVSLKCSATGKFFLINYFKININKFSTGNPTPEVTWNLDGFPLPSNGR